MSAKSKSGLTPQQKLWLETYVENALKGKFNATDAARIAYPDCKSDTQRTLAYNNYHNSVIRKEIEKALFDQRMPVEEIWKRWKDFASVDIQDFLTKLPDGKIIFDWDKAEELGVTHLIKKFKMDHKFDEDGNITTYIYDVEFHDAKDALKEMTKLQKMIDNRYLQMNLDLSKLPAEAVEAIAAGEDPLQVLLNLHRE